MFELVLCLQSPNASFNTGTTHAMAHLCPKKGICAGEGWCRVKGHAWSGEACEGLRANNVRGKGKVYPCPNLTPKITKTMLWNCLMDYVPVFRDLGFGHVFYFKKIYCSYRGIWECQRDMRNLSRASVHFAAKMFTVNMFTLTNIADLNEYV